MRARFAKPYYHHSRRASVLLAVLWVIAFLSFLIITTMMVSMQDVETVSSRQLVFRARELAESGIAIGAHPMIKPADPLLHRRISTNEAYDVNITSEEARFNINSLLTEEKRPVLERLFESWGLNPPDAQGVVDCLMDWVDTDDFKRLKGAEKQYYEDKGFKDRPFNRPFYSLDEVSMVAGMDTVAEVNPRWREAFTMWGQGGLDINEAPAELIAVAANAPIHLANALVSNRVGADGIPHTKDDQPIESVDEAMTLLGGNAGQTSGEAGVFILHGNTVRVESVGHAGDYSRGIAVVLQKSAGTPQILEWREFVPD